MPKQWFPLESNPEIMNAYIYKMGIDPTVQFHDVLSTDDVSKFVMISISIVDFYISSMTVGTGNGTSANRRSSHAISCGEKVSISLVLHLLKKKRLL